MSLPFQFWKSFFSSLGRMAKNCGRRNTDSDRRSTRRQHHLDALEPRIVLNADPVANDDYFTTAVDQAIQFDPTLNDTDADGDSLQVVGLYGRPQHGSLTWNADGTLTYTPDAGFVGTETMEYVVSDGHGNEDRGAYSITVDSPNAAPTANDVYVDGDQDSDIAGSFDAVDAEGDALTFQITSAPTNGTVVDNGDGTFTYTPDEGFSGDDSFNYTANDGSEDSNEVTVYLTVNPINALAPPTGPAYHTWSPTAQTGRQSDTTIDLDWTPGASGASYEIYFGVNGGTPSPDETTVANGPTTDPDAATTTVDGLEANTDYIFWIRAVRDGQYSNWVYADTEMTSGEEAPTNTPPTADDVYVNGDQDSQITAGFAAIDAENESLSFQIVSEPTNGTIVDNGDGTFTYTPNSGFTGEDSFTYRANDGTDDSNEATVFISVAEAENTPPTANDVYADLDQDTDITGDFDVGDDENDPLTFQIISGPTNGSVVVNGDGTFTYTPNAGFSGDDSFTYTANDGTDDSNEAAVYVTVHATNSPPTANDVYADGDQDSDITGSFDASDAEESSLTFQVVYGPTNGTVVDNGDGTFTYTPNAGFTGDDSFTYVANDGTEDSNEATVFITVLTANTPPTANDVYVDGDQDTDITGSFDAGDDESDPLSFQIVYGPTNGTVVDNGDGTFTYTPNSGFSGDDSFTYVANDGTADSNEATVYITVATAAGNTPPTANDVYADGDQDSDITGSFDASDAEGSPLTFQITSGPANGTVVDNGDGTFTYTPNAGFSGDDSFTYVANDGTDDSNEATVFITVAEAAENTPPEANDVYVDGDQDSDITGSFDATDAEGDALTFQITSGPANGTVVDNGDGTFTYTPAGGFSGEDSFTYVANDGTEDSNEATVYITVAPLCEPLTITSFYGIEGELVGIPNWTFRGTVTGEYAVGATITFGGVIAPGHTATVQADGTFEMQAFLSIMEFGDATAMATDSQGNTSEEVNFLVVSSELPE